MITEDKQLKTYAWAIVILLIYVISVALGMISDKYFWGIICLIAFGIPVSILINIILKGWVK